MNTSFFSSKLFYIIAVGIIFIVFITIILILQNLGGSGPAKATLEFWGVYDDRASFSDVVSALQKTEPGVKINYRQFSYDDYERSLIDALAAGTGPDLFMIHHTWLAKHRDKLVPLPNSSGSE